MRVSKLAALLPLLLLVACDKDGDGLTNSEEKDLGTDPELTDTDGDGLSDYDEHVDLGTDPLSADSDGDGWDDKDELDEGTDPLEGEYSHPYIGGYNTGDCGEYPTATGPTGRNFQGGDGYDVGDIVENYTWIDQYGQEVDLYSFCGKHILLDVGAFWWPSCKTAAGAAQGIQDQYGDAIQVINISIQNDSGAEPSQSDLEGWADQYGMESVPAVGMTGWEFELDGGIVTYYILGPGMEVLEADSGSDDIGKYL